MKQTITSLIFIAFLMIGKLVMASEIHIDIITEGGWGTDKEFKDMKLATPVSEGWLFSKDDETVRIFAGYDVESDGSIHFSERSVFPTSCVKKITRIH